MRKTFRIMPMVLLLVLLAGGCNSHKIKIVARVGNDLISVAEFEKEYLKAKPIYMAKNVSFQEKQKFLDQLLERSLQRQSAYQNAIDRDPVVQAKIADQRRRIIYTATLDHYVVYKIIKEKEIRDFYRKSRYEIRARQIMLKLPPHATQKQIDSTMAKARAIIEEIRSGADFAQLAEQYSDDRATRSKGGDLGFVHWGRMEEPILNVLFNLKKYELAQEPVQSSRGIHILQATDRRIMPQKPYEIERENIVQTLFRKYRNDLMNLYNDFNRKLDNDHQVVYHEENMEKIATFLKDSKNDSLYLRTVQKQSKDFSWIRPDLQELSLASYRNGKLTLPGILDFITDQGTPVPLHSKEEVRRVVQNILHVTLTIAIGERKGYLHRSPYQERFEKEKEKILVSALRNKEVNERIKISEEKLREYYTSNQEKFKVPARAEVQEILVSDQELAKKIFKWARSGKDFSDLAEKYNTRPSTKRNKGRLGKISARNYGIIGKTALEMKVGEIRGPLKTGKSYSVIKVLSREEERIKSFEEAKNSVRARLRDELVKKYEKEWKEKMRKQFPVRIFKDHLLLALKEID